MGEWSKTEDERPANKKKKVEDALSQVFICSDVGVTGITRTHAKKLDDGTWEARVGISIFGQAMMTDEQLEACEHNPFHPDYFDNYVSGVGSTKEEAIDYMKHGISKVCDTLHADPKG